MSLSVVVLVTLFNRPAYTRRCLAALSESFNVGELPILLSVDGPRNEEEMPAVADVQHLVNDWKEAHKAKYPGAKVNMLLSSGNLGVDEHKIQTIPFAMEWAGADSFIHIEDDILVARDGLNCLATLLARVETLADPELLSVTGYSWQPTKAAFDEFVAKGQYATVIADGYTSWGGGMLKATWDRLFADNGAEYRKSAAASGYAPDGVNGWFDSWVATPRSRPGRVKLLRPWIARAQQIGAEGGVHSQGVSHHYKYDYNEWGAWNLEPLKDNGLFGWGQG